jgi:hypothetical protein
MSVCAFISLAPTEQISVKYDTVGFVQKCVGEIPTIVEVEKIYQAFYMKTKVHFIIAGNIKLPS